MKKLLAVAIATVCLAGSAQAQVLTFEGIHAGGGDSAVGNFYNGGGGPNYGIEFFGNARAITSFVGECGGTGNFALQPSGCGILYFAEGAATGMNRAAGFTTGFSLFYASLYTAGSIEVYEGLNGTGTLLGSVALPANGSGTSNPACSGMEFCPWVASGLTFAGSAKSVLFSGGASFIGFDDVTFGSSTPGNEVPEPSTYVLMAAGLAGLGVVARRRTNAQI